MTVPRSVADVEVTLVAATVVAVGLAVIVTVNCLVAVAPTESVTCTVKV